MRSYLLAISLLILSMWSSYGYSQTEQGTASQPDLSILEQMARKQFEDGNPETALELYRLYEKQMSEEGWDQLQPDVLKNLAICSYRSDRLGEAMAYLKQLSLLRGSGVRNEIEELQMLIEMQQYQKAPETLFIRGNSSSYTYWETSHQFSRAELKTSIILVWSIIFILIAALNFIFWKGRFMTMLIDLIVMNILLLLVASALYITQKRTDDTQYGVITSTHSLREEIGEEGGLQDNAYTPGMTVRVVTKVPGWVKVERMDGELSWVDVHDLYLLRGRGEKHSSKLE